MSVTVDVFIIDTSVNELQPKNIYFIHLLPSGNFPQSITGKVLRELQP